MRGPGVPDTWPEHLPAPWDRQKSDDEQSWPAFVLYRDQIPPRRLIRYGTGASTTQLQTWYHAQHWRDRVEAWDRYLDDIRRAEYEAIVRQSAVEVGVAHMALLKDARELVARELALLLRDSNRSDASGLIKPSVLVRMLEATLKFERLVRDQTTENVGGGVDLSGLTDAELEILERAVARQSAQGGEGGGDAH